MYGGSPTIWLSHMFLSFLILRTLGIGFVCLVFCKTTCLYCSESYNNFMDYLPYNLLILWMWQGMHQRKMQNHLPPNL
jgi:hypothetical protein